MVEMIPSTPEIRKALSSLSLNLLRKRDSAVTWYVAMKIPMKKPVANMSQT